MTCRAYISSSGTNLLWGLDTLVSRKLSLIEPVDTTVQQRAKANPTSEYFTKAEKKVLHQLLYRLQSKYFTEYVTQAPIYSLYCTKNGKEHDEFPRYTTAPEICIHGAVSHTPEVVASVRFAFDLNAFLHLAMDVTPACEHCRTSISNVLWRNPISGFNGSSQATHPGSHEIYARVKLVYSISFPIFNYCHYCSACYWFPSQNGINKLWVDQK